MKKTKIILGMLIVMAITLCGILLINRQPQVFVAEASEQQEMVIENEAGKFYGQGYYVVGDTATLKAEMNAGYDFDGWEAEREGGNTTILSTELEYTFVVENNITIKPVYHKIEYSVTFAQDLFNLEQTELNDFVYTVDNKTSDSDPYYYDTAIEIVVNIKNDLYIYDLNEQNIAINGISLYNIIRTDNPMAVNYNIINDKATGFSQFVINLNIRENIVIDIDYTYMYQLTVVSGNNNIAVSEIIKFITLTNYYSQPIENEYIYLVRADKQVSITVGQGDDIYQFVLSQFQGQDPSIVYSQAYTLYQNSTFVATYNKKDYTVSFQSYLTNLYGNNDIMQNPFYDIESVQVTAGDGVKFEYDDSTKNITITDIVDDVSATYEYPLNTYGYKFVGFAIDGQIITDTTYTLSNTAPQNVEIQLIFEYIEYSFNVELVDTYFEDDVVYSINYDNKYNKAIIGSVITVQASTANYAINGWSWSATPKVGGYLKQLNEMVSSDSFTFNFAPLSDDNTYPYTLYLDVDYKYITTYYNLKQNSIVKNVDYDVVAVDLANSVIVFSDSENPSSIKEISYTEISTDETTGVTSINALDMGILEIKENTLSYTVNSIKVTSISKETASGVDVYTFKKYTYFGELQMGVVEYISLTENGTDVTFALGGTIFGDNGQALGDIQTVTTTKVYQDSVGAYLIDYHYPMYLYMNGEEYDYISLRDTKYYFNGTRFELASATINIPKQVASDITKSSTYTIQLSNVLSNTLVVYYTKSINDINYSFTSYTNQSGSSLWNYIYNGYNTCLLSVASVTSVNVEYRQLANNIMLVINQENAYQYENISFSLQSAEGNSTGTGNTISAKDGDIVTIIISQDSITKGYKFDNYVFNNEIMTSVNSPLMLIFTMDSNIYANQTIIIEFSEIIYTVNINYIDANSTIITQDSANGGLRLQGQTNWLTSQLVSLTDEYIFEAVANSGYYVNKAYIGSQTESNTLLGLIGNNEQTNLTTIWQLNSSNFEQLIINNASDTNEVNLYINFKVHTYSVKVYFEIATNASAITYPTLYVNGEEQILTVATEEDAGVSITKRFVVVDGFDYASNITLQLDNFMLGTTMAYWSDAKGQQLTTTNNYNLIQISQNIVLKVTLQYVSYMLEFVTLDDQGENCNYGSVSTTSKTVKLLDTVYYTINTEIGYVLTEKYYYDSANSVVNENINSGFIFNPSKFKIENATIKIYLVFSLKVINLEISNSVDGNMYYFKEQDVNDLATYIISRQRGNTIEQLNYETGYQFKTGDILIMQIKPISIGIELSQVQLGSTNITLSSVNPYQLSTQDVKENGTLVGMYYELRIEFNASVINGLEDVTALQNVLKVKTFNITYTYNYIDYKFGIRLIRQYSGSTATGSEDVEMLIKNVGYGTEIMFRYNYEGMNSGDGEKFKVDGFSVEGIKQDVSDRFVFNDIDLWNQIVLSKYSANSNEIKVVLVLKPKITLNNYTVYTDIEGYVYERAYIGENQGLTLSGSNPDIVIGGDFQAIVHYSFDTGISYVDEKPINVGEYQVKIIAKIISEDSQITEVVFDERVKYIITQATITISLKTYSTNNPVTKTYDGTNNLSSKVIVDDIIFNGLYSRDVNNVFVDASRLRVQFEDVSVNDVSKLYDITVFDIYLLDSASNTLKNYKISSGQNLIFSRIGKINPKELTITGFVAKDKVYDGTNQVVANLEGVNYIGKLATDSTQILTENLKFYVEDYAIGKDKEVFIDWSTALVGADSINYTIIYNRSFIDIYPYEITYYLKDYGTFKIVDRDGLCLIPIESRMYARVFDKGSSDYRLIYSTIEPDMTEGEKLKYCYEVIIQVGSVNLSVPEGLYVYIPKVNKVTKVLQVPEDAASTKLEYVTQEDFSIIKVVQGDALFGVVVRTTYLPLWLIILIVILSLLLVGTVVAIFIVVRRKTKNKYSSYHKI